MAVDASFEQRFDEYRERLHDEVSRLAMYVRIYRRLHERMADRVDEMNIAPAFFQVVNDALFSVIVIWIDKLFDEHGGAGFFNFLTYVEHNRSSFSVSELKRRRQYPDGHWMLDRESITLDTVDEHRRQIRELEALPSFTLRRDKFHAHFDKAYFFERGRLATEAPLTWPDLEKATDRMWDILNTYSTAFDGKSYAGEPLNAADVDYLLDALHAAREGKQT